MIRSTPRRLAVAAGALLIAGLAAAALASIVMSLRYSVDTAISAGFGAGLAAMGRSGSAMFAFHAFIYLIAGFPVAAAGVALAEWRSKKRLRAYLLGGALVPLNPTVPPADALFAKNDTAALLGLLALYAAIGALGGLVYWRLAGRRSGEWQGAP